MVQVATRVNAREVPLPQFVITKQLTKRPEEYPDAKNQPHVQVAMRRKAAGLRNGIAQVSAHLAPLCSSLQMLAKQPKPHPLLKPAVDIASPAKPNNQASLLYAHLLDRGNQSIIPPALQRFV